MNNMRPSIQLLSRPSMWLALRDPRWLLRLQTSFLFFSQLDEGKERKSMLFSFRTFPRSGTRLFLYSVIQNLMTVVVGNCSLYFAPLKMWSPVSKEEEGTEMGNQQFLPQLLLELEARRFLKITALISFPNLGWFLPQGKQVGT